MLKLQRKFVRKKHSCIIIAGDIITKHKTVKRLKNKLTSMVSYSQTKCSKYAITSVPMLPYSQYSWVVFH